MPHVEIKLHEAVQIHKYWVLWFFSNFHVFQYRVDCIHKTNVCGARLCVTRKKFVILPTDTCISAHSKPNRMNQNHRVSDKESCTFILSSAYNIARKIFEHYPTRPLLLYLIFSTIFHFAYHRIIGSLEQFPNKIFILYYAQSWIRTWLVVLHESSTGTLLSKDALADCGKNAVN